jgi:LPS-assembly protein
VANNKKRLPRIITGILLTTAAADVYAATSPWDCRPSADGSGWSCAQDGGEYEAPIKPATPKAIPQSLTSEQPSSTDAVADDGLAYENVPKSMRWINPEFLANDKIWNHCSTQEYNKPYVLPINKPNRANAKVGIVSDHVEMDKNDGITHFVGNVAITRADQRIQGSRISYDNQENSVSVVGDVTYKESGLLFTNGKEAFFNLDNNTGSMDEVSYTLDSVPARGAASHVEVENQDITHFTNLNYTSCRPGNQDWQLDAEALTLNKDTGVGEARHATLRFLGLPIFYSPYYSFPLDERRKSGFLAPIVGNSDDNGFDLSAPFYWDIAANLDATITPRILSKRGVQLAGEFRYLLPEHNGRVYADFLPGDDLTDSNRGQFSLQHSTSFSENLSGRLDLNYVSDEEFFEDFGGSVAFDSISSVQRLAELSYQDEYSTALARVQYFQTVDDTINKADRPFQRLPQVQYNYERGDRQLGLTHHLNSEVVYFDHSSNQRESGARVDLQPGLSLPISTLGWFVTPRLDVRHTYYDLDSKGALNDDNFTRTLPIFSVDSGLFFEKETSFFGTDYMQTLEPRLFYLYVPNENQDDFPNFDTTEFDFSFSQMFRTNRFNSADRQGDANQVTYALTSRLLDDDNGREVVTASIGQIIFFEDREVTLGGVQLDDDKDPTSPIIAELGWNITRAFSTGYTVQFDPHEEFTSRNEFRVRYHPDQSHLINFDYRQRRGILEETDISFRWKLLPQWHVLGRNQYSLRDNHVIESFAGLEYESCCWVGRVLVQHSVNDVEDIDNNGDHDADTAIFFQLELKGFASIGDKITDRIQQGIINYNSFQDK